MACMTHFLQKMFSINDVLKIIFYYLSIFFVGTSSRGLRIKLVTSENAHDLYTHGKR